MRAIKAAAQSLAMEAQVLEFRNPAELEVVLTTAIRGRARALIQLSTPLAPSISKKVAEFGATNRLPVISLLRRSTEEGGLISYGPDLAHFYGRAAVYVDKILKGANPAELPVEQPAKFELVINLKSAKALGLTIPPTLLARADKIIE